MPFPAGNPAGQVVHPKWSRRNRPVAESVLEDRCTITRVGTAGELNTETGRRGPARTTVTTNLACRVSYASSPVAARRGDFAEETVDSATHLVQLPSDWTDVQPGDEITITASGDPHNLGRRYQVLKDGAATYTWTRLLRCEHLD